VTNHVHILITPPSAVACSLMMRDLLRCYAAYFNRRYSRTGSLWERPFRSCLVESSEYVLNCYRYIERNPVRAGMAPSPGAYRWSSYAGNARERVHALLTPHVEYVALSEHEEREGQAYRSLMAMSDDPAFLRAIRETTEAGYPLVGEALGASSRRTAFGWRQAVPAAGRSRMISTTTRAGDSSTYCADECVRRTDSPSRRENYVNVVRN
jgi:putative transposase